MKNNKPLNILIINDSVYYPIYEFDGKYYIKESGDVVYTTVYKRELKTQINKDGYYYNNLIFNSVQKKRFYHRLIADNLLLKTDSRQFINHKNSNRQDNSISNLEWVHKYENYYHGIGVNNYKQENNTNQRLLTDEEIKEIYTSKLTRKELIEKIPKLTRRTHHDIKHDRLYIDVTKNLIKGKSQNVIRKEELNAVGDTVIFDIWITEYINSNKSLKTIGNEFNFSPSFIKRRFENMNLPIKSGGRYNNIVMSLK